MICRVTPEQVLEAYSCLCQAKVFLFQQIEAETEARADLKKKESVLMMSGAIIGKNAEARDAQLREGCSAEIELFEKARISKDKLQLAHELALMEIEKLKLLIRLDELAAKAVV